jgi:hypothetical protein
MRIAGGVLLLLVGLWSLVGGGCSLIGGAAVGQVGKMGNAAAELAKASGGKVDAKAQAELDKALAQGKSVGSGLLVSGIVILLAGILCIVGGIMFFVNKAKAFGFLAPAVGIIGEILFFVMVGFNIAGVIKILIYAFGAFAATKIGAEA